jgi:hypothetical protein
MVTWAVDGNYTAAVPDYSDGYIQTCESTSVFSYVQYNCLQYAVLQGLTSTSCVSYVSVPDGWSVAENTVDSRTALKTYASDLFTSGVTCILFADGTGLDSSGNICSATISTLNSTCYAVDCSYRLLLVGSAISGCTSTTSTCSASVASSILYQTPSTKSSSDRLYPSQYATYFNPTATSTPLKLNFTVTNKTPLVDVMILLDLLGMTSNTVDQVKNYAKTFYNSLTNSGYSAQVGLATFTTSGSSHSESYYSYLTSSSSTLSSNINSLSWSSTSTSTSSSLSLQAVAALMQNSNVGWRTGAFSSVLLITSQSYSTYQDLSSLSISTGVVPLFLVLNTNSDRTAYNTFSSLASALPLSYAGFISSPTSWYTAGPTLVSSMVTSVVARPLSDSYGFLTATASSTLSVGSSTVLYFTATYPSSLTSSSVTWPVTATVRLFGYSSPIFLISANTPPTLTSIGTVSVAENSNATITLKASDAEGNTLSIMLTSVTHGLLYTTSGAAVSLNTAYSTFSVIYVPTSNYYGAASIGYSVTDGCATTSGTAAVNVTFVNQAPVAKDFTFTISENEATLSKQLIDFTSYISDVEDTATKLTVKILTIPTSLGTLQYTSDGSTYKSVSSLTTLPALKSRFVPTSYQYGTVTFTYSVTDTNGATSNTATVTVIVTFSNTAPTSSSLTVTTSQDTPVAIDKITYYDPDSGQTIKLFFASLPTGTLTSVSTSSAVSLSTSLTYATSTSWNLTYTPPSGAYSADGVAYTTFTFKVNDGYANSTTYTVSIYVTKAVVVNTAPTAKDFTFTINEDETDTTSQTISFKPYINDTETPNNLTVALTSLPDSSKGTVINSDGTSLSVGTTAISNAVRFVPAQHKYGTTTFKYTVTDPSGLSATAMVTVVITYINYPPTSENVTITLNEISQQSVSLAAPVSISGADIESTSLTLVIVSLPSKGLLINPGTGNYITSVPYSLSGGLSWTVNFLPAQYGYGTPYDTFTYQVYDGENYSGVYYATINVNYVNQPPVGKSYSGTTKEDTPLQVSLTASDPDDDTSSLDVLLLSFSSSTAGVFYTDSSMTTTVSAGTQLDGTSLYFVPNDGVYSVPTTSPVVTFTFKIVDPHGLTSTSTYTGVIYVTFVDKPPYYEGALNITVYEEAVAAINLASLGQDINNNNDVTPTYTITITEMISRGYLWECTDDSSSCTQWNISTTPYVVQNSGYTLYFTSLSGDHGELPDYYYATFKFTVSSSTTSLVSAVYTYTIFVLPVWHAPVLVPRTFAATPTRTYTDENTPFVLEWTAYNVDKEFDNSTLTSRMSVSSDYAAKYYTCVESSDNDCVQGDEIILPATITTLRPALWRVLFVPETDTYDTLKYATFTFVATNTNTSLSSAGVKAIMIVQPINQAPTITAEDVTVQTPDDLTIGIASVSVSDPDSGTKDIYLEVSVVSDTTTSLSLSVSSYLEGSRSACTQTTNQSFTCTDSQANLRTYLSSLYIKLGDNSTSSVLLNIYVNDLGHTDKLDRALNATKNMTVTITDQGATTTTESTVDNGVPIGVSIAGAAALAGAAVLIWRLKNRAGPADDYFESLNSGSTDASNNPLYQERNRAVQSPLYQAKNLV